MNPNAENQPKFEVVTQLKTGENAPDQLEAKPTISPENSTQSSSAADAAAAASSVALPAQAIGTDDDAADVILDADIRSANATDTDRIEKEWIDKAKSIIAQTQSDPFEQKREMSKVKAEYIQKRFNKTIKTDDAVLK